MKKIFAILVLLFGFFGFGQISTALPKFIPASPTSSELGKYGRVPVGLFTGTPNITIPIFNSSNIDITLNYSSNGIKVDQISSNVGLGWSLNSGGVITRSLNDEVDELYREELLEVSDPNYIQSLRDAALTEHIDTEPDIFSFNFNGIHGKFYLDENLNPKLINPLPIKVEWINGFNAFKITDSSGNKYWFENIELSSTRAYGKNFSTMTDEIKSAWYLSKTILNNGEELLFTYNNFNSTHDVSISQNIAAKITYSGGGIYISPAYHELPTITKSYTITPMVKNISLKNIDIEFNYSLDRLQNILIHNDKNVLIKKVEFYYTEYTTLNQYANNDNIGNDPNNDKRVFLNNIIFFNDNNIEGEKYSFQYFSPDELPPKLSYARDYWGFFNGEDNIDLVTEDLSNIYSDIFPLEVMNQLFTNVGGNRNPNSEFGIKGLLKRITYPTKGSIDFYYEPHSYYGVKYTYPNEIMFEGDVESSEMGVTSAFYTTENIPFTQLSNRIYTNTDKGSCFNDGDPTHNLNSFLKVTVADQGSDVFHVPTNKLFYNLTVGGLRTGHTNNISTNIINNNPPYYIDFLKNKKYKFEVMLNRECIIGGFTTSYYPTNMIETNDNIEVGGLRIERIEKSFANNNIEVTKYHYGNLDCLNCSSGNIEIIRPSMSVNTYLWRDINGEIESKRIQTYTLTSNSSRPLYDSQSNYISYSSIIEERGNNFNEGCIVHDYNVVFDNIPIYDNFIIPGTPYSNGFGNGDEILTRTYKKESGELIIRNSKEYIYEKLDDRLDNFITGYNVGVYYSENFYPHAFIPILNRYKIKTHWNYLKSEINKIYDVNGEITLETNKNFFYENENHLQLTRTVTTDSNNNTLETKNYYPQDKSLLVNLTSNASVAIDSLVSQNRITTPIQTKNIKNGNLLTKTRINFKDFGLNALGTNNIIKPERIQSSKGTNALEDIVTYHQYDDAGNPLELSKANGIHICYIWGYNKTKPIAKIVGVSFSDVQGYVSAIQTASDNDDDRTVDIINGANIFYQGNEGILRQELNTLRTNLLNAQVTTMTYDPLIGLTSATDPKGDIQYYYYDSFNRLQYVKDKDGNILSENEYHYRD